MVQSKSQGVGKLSPDRRAAEGRRRWVGLASLALFVAFFVLVAVFVGQPLLRWIGQPEAFRAWVDAHGVWGRLAFVGMACLQVVVAIIPGEPLEIGAGYAFGPWEGLALCLAGYALGSVLIYGLTKLWGVRLAEALVPEHKLKALKFLQNTRKLNLLVFLGFLIPGTPKDLLCYLIGLTPMRLIPFLWISGAARIPSILTSTLGGDALGVANYPLALWVFAATALITLAGVAYYRHLSKQEKERKAQ